MWTGTGKDRETESMILVVKGGRTGRRVEVERGMNIKGTKAEKEIGIGIGIGKGESNK